MPQLGYTFSASFIFSKSWNWEALIKTVIKGEMQMPNIDNAKQLKLVSQ